ncbi:protein SSUH2 homolog [Lycodopsis pacificus]
MGDTVYPPPTAPGANMFGSMPGYEGMAAGGGFLAPPMPLGPVAPPQPGPDPEEWIIPTLSEDIAREAFRSFVSTHSCYSESPVNDGVITNMEPFNTYRYQLETFTETRKTEQAEKPYEGEQADFNIQPAPQPWDIPAKTPSFFTKHKQNIRVPFTSSIKECTNCNALGTVRCQECNGNGTKPCVLCNGSGRHNEQGCSSCDATGKKRCIKCNARGNVDCESCEGKRQMLSYIKLKVKWTNHEEYHVVPQHSGLQIKLDSVSGKQLFQNSHSLLYPLLGFPNPAISEASQRMIKDHQTKYGQTSRILQQRQTVELIPITKVNYKWKGEAHLYYVYGNENEVRADNYPATCCCVIQ